MLTVLAAAETVPVAREPTIELVRKPSNEGKPEDPSKHPPLGQDAKERLDRFGPLRRAPAGSDELKRIRVRPAGNPRESRRDARVLRRKSFNLFPSIPTVEQANESPANFAMPIVDKRPRPALAAALARLSGEHEAHDRISL